MRLIYGIAFLSGMNADFDDAILNGFQNWLVEEYFDEPQSFAWEVLINKIPECSTDDDTANLDAFLKVMDRYLSSLIHI